MKRWYFILPLLILFQCNEKDPSPSSRNNPTPRLWADLTLHVIFNYGLNSPTYSSRSLGYMGLTMYECVVGGSTKHQSLQGQLNGLTGLPERLPELEYDDELALNAGQAWMLKSLYPDNETLAAEIDALENEVYESRAARYPDATIPGRSAAYGRAVAEAIYNWSLTDGGHRGQFARFDFAYEYPRGDGYWTPPLVGQLGVPFPMHPSWKNNRTFVPANSLIDIPAMLTYSSAEDSPYWLQFKEVYDIQKNLTQEQRNIAAWWADDPTQTASPPGHSYNLATICLNKKGADLYTGAEVYARTGMAVADAFINCWKAKYTYHSERPAPFIIKFIDPNYQIFWPEPPFPAFSSGHATQSAAAATVLTAVFGENFRVFDTTHEGRPADFPGIVYEPRAFPDIWSTAVECAESRLYGGIHTRQDNEAGQTQGIAVGNNVNDLNWYK